MSDFLTSFFVFRIQARHQGEQNELSFVLNLPTNGLPQEREHHILHAIISDRNAFVRYLLLLLEDDSKLEQELWEADELNYKNTKGLPDLDIRMPLFEQILKAYSREPKKIERISKLIDDLKKSDDYSDIFPPQFEVMWSAFQAAYEHETSK